MNKKLIGGIVLLGGIGVIAYYFLFSKKSEQDLLKKFEEKKKNEAELAKIDVDLSIGLIKSEGLVPTLPFTTDPKLFFAPSFKNLSPKELSDIKAITDTITAPTVNINPINIPNWDFKDFNLAGLDLEKLKNFQSGKTPALPTW